MSYSRSIIGSSFLIAGTLLFGVIHLAVANMFTHSPGTMNIPGQFNDFLGSLRLKVPYIISILFMCVGLLILISTFIKNHSRKE